MKKCSQCGALQKDERVTCIDCGERLGKPLSNVDEKKIDYEITKKMKKLSAKSDFYSFHATVPDKVVAGLLVLIVVAQIVLRIFWGSYMTMDNNLSGILFVILMIMGIVDLLLPQFSWELYKLRFIFSIANTDDLEPSTMHSIMRRVTVYGLCLLAFVYSIAMILEVTHNIG